VIFFPLLVSGSHCLRLLSDPTFAETIFLCRTASNWQYSSAINLFGNKRTRQEGRDETHAQAVPLILKKIVFAEFLSSIDDIIRQRKKGAVQFKKIF